MSETVQYRGKLEVIAQVEMDGNVANKEQMADAAQLILDPYDMLQFPDFYGNWLEVLRDCEDFVIHNDKIYKVVIKNEIQTGDDRYEAAQQGDNIIYDVQFYNGGCGFNEAIVTALDNMKEI